MRWWRIGGIGMRAWVFAFCCVLPATAQADQWTGVYIGGAIGAGRMSTGLEAQSTSTDDSIYRSAGTAGADTFRSRQHDISRWDSATTGSSKGETGPFSGPLVGASARFGIFVVGGEVSLDWVDFPALMRQSTKRKYQHSSEYSSSTNGGPFISQPAQYSQDEYGYELPVITELDWKAAAVGRLGVLVGEQLHVYGLAGLARGGFTGAPKEMQNGFVVGGGAELALGGNWFGRIEYRYTEFRSFKERVHTSSFVEHEDETPHVGYTQRQESSSSSTFDASTHDVRLGVTYKFWSWQ